MTRFRMAMVAAAMTLSCVLVAPAFAPGARSKTAAPAVVATVTGTAADGTTFTGTFQEARAFVQDRRVFITGTVTGTLTNAAGATLGTVTQQVTTNVVRGLGARHLAATTARCGILDLTLGPLDLNLLGLVVHLDRVHLTIDAVSAPGNLLGNLLCAVTHLLDGPASSNAIANFLNRILANL
jgi:hypothetical protein